MSQYKASVSQAGSAQFQCRNWVSSRNRETLDDIHLHSSEYCTSNEIYKCIICLCLLALVRYAILEAYRWPKKSDTWALTSKDTWSSLLAFFWLEKFLYGYHRLRGAQGGYVGIST